MHALPARLCSALVTLLLTAIPALADGEKPGDFDYYVMSLSWSPNWCVLTGDARGDDQCDPSHAYTFTLHGLWPQSETGYPSNCHSTLRDPTRTQTAAMTDITGSAGLAWYEWKKHGRCAGLSASDYFAKSRKAYDSVVIPDVFTRLTDPIKLPASVVQDAFLEVNPAMTPNMITITCDEGYIQEARVCLTKDLKLRECSADVVRDCDLTSAVMESVR